MPPRLCSILPQGCGSCRRARLHACCAAAALAGAAVLGLAACSRAGGDAPPPAPPALPVTVLDAQPRALPLLIEAVGQAEGAKQVEVRARVSGILERTGYREGEPVAAGARLFRIDRRPYEIARDQAGAALAQERSRLENLERDATRLTALAADRSISQREADDAGSGAKTQRAAVDAAEARLRDAQLNLSYTDVTAPIAGVTGRALRSEGSLVSAGGDTALLTTITQTDPIWVRFALSDAQFAQLRANPQNTEVKVVLPDGRVYAEKGRVNFRGSTVDERIGTVQLRAELRNPALAVLPGQTVRVQVYTGEQRGVLVPQVAVVQNDRGRFVWVIGPDGKALQRPVQVGSWVGQDWLVFKGLDGGEQVIVDNLIKLRPGAAVTAQAAPPPPPVAAPPAGQAPAGSPPAGSSSAGSPPAANRAAPAQPELPQVAPPSSAPRQAAPAPPAPARTGS